MHNTDRIGSAALNTNQNIAGRPGAAGAGRAERFLLWVAACLLVLALTVWATRRVLRAGEPTLAVICIALFGLVVSPVSWSHHWVWMLPTVLVTAVLAWRRRNLALARGQRRRGGADGVDADRPASQAPRGDRGWWRQLAGMSYVWWALAIIVAAGLPSPPAATRRPRQRRAPAPVSAVS